MQLNNSSYGIKEQSITHSYFYLKNSYKITILFLLLSIQSGKLFGGNKDKDKEGTISPVVNNYEDLQMALKQEKKKNARLQEQNERLRQENYSHANECKLKG